MVHVVLENDGWRVRVLDGDRIINGINHSKEIELLH